MSDKDLIQEAIDYARRYWQHGSETRTQYVLKVLADALEARQVDEARIRTLIDRAILHASERPDCQNEPEPTPINGKWVCGKCAREIAQGYDDGQIPEHHRTCPKRHEPEPDARQPSENLVCEPRQDAALPWSGVKITPSENDVRERIAGEIEADLEDGSSCIQHVYFAEGMRHAAEIARSGR